MVLTPATSEKTALPIIAIGARKLPLDIINDNAPINHPNGIVPKPIPMKTVMESKTTCMEMVNLRWILKCLHKMEDFFLSILLLSCYASHS